MTQALTAELLVPPSSLGITQATVTEGPLWWNDSIYFVDIPPGRIFRISEDGEVLGCANIGSEVGMVGTITPCSSDPNVFIAATQRGIAFIDFEHSKVLSLHSIAIPENGRMNDGKAGPDGAFYAGTCTMTFDKPLGALWRIRSPKDMTPVIEGIYLTNGLGWTTEGKFVYIDSNDPRGHIVRSYNAESKSGTFTNEKIFVQRKNYPKFGEFCFDGLYIDRANEMWLAEWGAGVVSRWTSKGEELEGITVPTSCPTCCCIGGKAGEYLFITSERRPQDKDPAGGIFRCKLDKPIKPLTFPYTGPIA